MKSSLLEQHVLKAPRLHTAVDLRQQTEGLRGVAEVCLYNQIQDQDFALPVTTLASSVLVSQQVTHLQH